MSVYIQGMEMPKGCTTCPMYDYDREIYREFCRINCEEVPPSVARKPEWCPLVEIKTPHGRLIDENYLLSLMDNGDHYPTGLLDAADIYYDPTIIEAKGGGEDGN